MKKLTKENYRSLIQGAAYVLLGILLAVFGGANVIDKYFGIMLLIGGAILVAAFTINASQDKDTKADPLVFAGACIVLGIAFLSNTFTFQIIIDLLAYIILGGGCGLLVYGLYKLIMKSTTEGIFLTVFSALVTLLAALFIWVSGFQKAFWILIGIVVILAGLYLILNQFFDLDKIGKKSSKKQSKTSK